MPGYKGCVSVFETQLRDYRVSVHTDNSTVVYYINLQGFLHCSFTFVPFVQIGKSDFVLVREQDFIVEIYILEQINQGSDLLLRQDLMPGGWHLHAGVVEHI